MNDKGDYEIEGRERLGDPLDLFVLEDDLIARAEDSGLVATNEQEGLVLRERVPHGEPIRTQDIACLSLDVSVFMAFDSDMIILIEDSTLRVWRSIEGKASRPVYEIADAIDELLSRCGVSEWEGSYYPEFPILDGLGWDLLIVLKDGRALVSGGCNAWPETLWDLADGMATLVGL
ncbi:MAG: hypothetical protein IJI15_07350 [Atopobiaceae bacterium]|nr:hypothetical protein [Atopobiaceae bacterium]